MVICTILIDFKRFSANIFQGRRGAVYDPRSSTSEVGKFNLHSGTGRESRILFVDENKFISSGFTNVSSIILGLIL